MKIRGTNVTIQVKNMDKSIGFYEGIGLTLKNRWGDHYAMVETIGLTIGLHPSEIEELSSGSVSLGFRVDTIGEAKALLEKNNISYKAEDDGKSGKYLHFKDPDKTLLYFVESKW